MAGENGGLVSGVFYELLRWDYIRGKKRNFPLWYTRRYSKERHRKLFEIYFNEQFSFYNGGSGGIGKSHDLNKCGLDNDMKLGGKSGAGKGCLFYGEETKKMFRHGFLHSDYDVFLFDVESPFPEDSPGTYEKLIIYNSR